MLLLSTSLGWDRHTAAYLWTKKIFFNYRGSFETFTKRQQGGLIGRRNETRVMNTYSCEWDVVLREII